MKHSRTVDALIVIIVMLVYCFNRFYLKQHIDLPIIGYLLRCHFNDFCGGLVFLAYYNLVISFSRYQHLRLKKLCFILLASIGLGVVWEGFIPIFVWYSVADIWDCVAYVLAGMVYWLLLNLLD